MYFKRLEIFGFKSFGDKTALNFEPGITAIVGPNGCGKSNIFDSIRWVLGEQSVKELRGSSMEDVIFNGTDKKPGLGFAEVSLTFSNESKMLPVEESEVMITRRLFRSGESEYLLNKQTCRLKDIQEMLMGTGIGAEAYSLVQQGKVDLVVSARPEDRRLIFDEAAGITKYKSKKREALNKLKDTENNLLRLNDIILEVKRQIGSIERQANKARKYKEEFEKLKILEVRMAKRQIETFNTQKSAMGELLEGLKTQETQLHAQLEEFNNLLDHEADLLSDFEQKINDLKSEELKIESQIEMNTRQIGFNQERIETLTLNESRLEQQKHQLLERCRIQQEKIEELKSDLLNLGLNMEQDVHALEEKRRNLQVIVDAVQQSKESIHKDEEKILVLNSNQVKIKNELTEIMKEFQNCLARKRRLEMESTKVSSEKTETDEKLQNICSEIDIAFKKLDGLKADQQAKTQALNDLRTQLLQLESTIADLEKQKLFLNSQKQFIEEMRVQYQDMPDPVVECRLLTTTAPMQHHTGIIGKVKEVTPAAPGKYDQDGLFEIVCETKFIELDPQQITVKIESISQEIVAHNQKKLQMLTAITEGEDLVNQVLQAVHAEEKALSIFESQQKNILQESNKLVGEMELIDSELKEAKDALALLKEKEDALARRLSDNEQELQWCQGNIKEQQNFITVKSHQREETTVLIAQLEKEVESFKDKEKNIRDNLTMFTETLDSSLGEIKRIDEEVFEDRQKCEQLNAEIVELENRIIDLRQKKESFKGTLAEYNNRKTDISQRLNSIKANSVSIEQEIQQIREQLHAQQLKDQELAFSERGIKDRLFQTYKLNFDEVMNLTAEQLMASTSSDPDAAPQVLPEMSDEELIVEIERLKKRCDSFGSVNLVAIEEYEELKQRYEFLTQQQQDLLTAKESLHDTINKINRTTRQMFMDTFTQVGESFRIYFRMLFGGGEGQLVLLDPDNVLESGIEIIARPPGKKLQSISLMSGGEKTMTAIALIFGVFKVRPSPFCVLDEIDAALDESNVGRFGYLLKDFAKIAQFIVVTHNKKTIANADVMYGITMQETGISKIVSVKFAEKDKKATAEVEEPVAA